MTNDGALHAIGNAHIDPVWLWRWMEGLEAIRSTFRSALDRMNEYPDFIFTSSSAAFYHQLAKVDPAMIDEIRQRVAEGRWEIVGGWWLEPDANIPSGEALVRQELYGQKWFEKNLGVKAAIGYNPDTFGHPGTLPQILQQAGISAYTFLRPMQNEKELPGNVFWWTSPDGSAVLASRITRAYCTWFDEMDEHVQINHDARPDYVRDYTVYYGVGNHGGGPTIKNIDSLHRMQQDSDKPALILSSLTSYFESLQRDADNGADIPEVSDELHYHARGCYSVHSEVKRQNRQTEHLLLNAEKFASICHAKKIRLYPAEDLRNAWYGTLYNQFHDILAGSSLPLGYDDARDLYGYAKTIAAETLYFSIHTIAAQVDTTGAGGALVVFNPLPWEATVPIEIEPGGTDVADADGGMLLSQQLQPTTTQGHQKRILFTATLPSMGYRLFRQNVDQSDSEIQHEDDKLVVTDSTLENDFWKISIDSASGDMIELFDKKLGVKVIEGSGAACVVIDDASDTWSHDVASFRNEIGRFGDSTITIEESGPVRASVMAVSRWGASSIIRRYRIYRDIPQIDVALSINWQEQCKALKFALPTLISSPVITAEVPYGSAARPANGEEQPGQQWMDVSGVLDGKPYGLALLNDSKYSYDALESELRLMILRSPAFAHHDPEVLDPEKNYAYMDQGWQDVQLRLVPHAGSWQQAGIPRLAYQLNNQPVYVNEYQHAGEAEATQSLLSVDAGNIIITTLKLSEDKKAAVIRGYETDGKSAHATITSKSPDVSFNAHFAPFQIKSFRIDLETGNVSEVNLLEE